MHPFSFIALNRFYWKKEETLTLTQFSVGDWANQEQGNDEPGDRLRFPTRKCRNMWRNVSLDAAETLGLEEKNAADWIDGGRARGPKKNSQRFLFSILSPSCFLLRLVHFLLFSFSSDFKRMERAESRRISPFDQKRLWANGQSHERNQAKGKDDGDRNFWIFCSPSSVLILSLRVLMFFYQGKMAREVRSTLGYDKIFREW